MKCPKCKKDNSIVIDSREHGDTQKRVRQCVECGYKWNTYEEWCKKPPHGNGKPTGVPKWLERDGRIIDTNKLRENYEEKMRKIKEVLESGNIE